MSSFKMFHPSNEESSHPSNDSCEPDANQPIQLASYMELNAIVPSPLTLAGLHR